MDPDRDPRDRRDHLLGEATVVTSWPTIPDPWLVDYIVWRINSGKAGTKPTTVPAVVPPYADDVLGWCIWRRKGRPEPRPPFPTVIPAWAYKTLDDVNKRSPIQIPTAPRDAWLTTWVIWRFKNSPEPRPTNVPDEVSVVAPYCWSVLNWVAWQRARYKDPLTPRPKNIPASIPQWCWDVLRKTNQAVPLGPPPPPPPPPGPPKPLNTWNLPFPAMTTAWGWFSDSDYRDNDNALKRMRDAGVKTVLLQIGQYEPDVPARCRAFGFKVALWGTPQTGDQEAISLSRADGYMPQVETPDEYRRALANFQAGYGQGISRSVFTTLYGFNNLTRRPPTQLHPEGELTTEEYEAMREYCTHGLIECYIQDGGAHFPIKNMMFAAMQRGFDYYNPAIGLWNEASIASYRPPDDPNTLNSFGRQIGVYLSEGMTPVNWVELKALGT